MNETEVKEYVKKRYSEIAQMGASCCPTTCCTPSTLDVALQIGYSKEDLENIPEAASMGLGCGNPVALASLQEGETVLDLGSGGGIDVFLAAKKVGATGKAIGVDMTEDMIERAAALAKQHGYTNVQFKLGEIENLPIEDESIDVVISNCVINLAPNKAKVFREVYRVLKPTGRLLISDIVTEGELPEEIKQSFSAWAGCVAGALERNQYLETIQKAGFADVRIVAESTYDIDVSEILREKITSVQVEAYKNVKLASFTSY
jgi:ubiquinone/menaquinone biosynthesis C-methylase UbiE